MAHTRGYRIALIVGFATLLSFFGLFTGRVNLLFYGNSASDMFSLYAHSAEIGQIVCLFSLGVFAFLNWRLAEKLAPVGALVFLLAGFIVTLYQATNTFPSPLFPIMGGALFGGGQGICYATWLMVYSRITIDDALKSMIASTMLSALFLVVIGLISSTLILFSTLFLLVVCSTGLLFLCLRQSLNKESEVERSSITAQKSPEPSAQLKSWLLLERRPFLCLLVVAFVFGAQRVIFLEGFLPQEIVTVTFSIGLLVGATLFWIVRKKLGSDENYYGMYSALLVVMATCGLVSAFQGIFVQAVLYAIGNIAFSLVSMCMVATVLRTTSKLSFSPLFVAGIVCGIMYFSIQLGRIVCELVSKTVGMNATGILVVSIIIVYIVTLVAVSTGAFLRKTTRNINLSTALHSTEEDNVQLQQTIISIAQVSEKQLRENPVYSRQLGLTTRELDVAILLLAGYNASDIAKLLTISTNTVKTHLKNLYVKMDVHNRREFINLVNEIERNTAEN